MSSDLVERLFNRAAIHDDDAWGPNNDTLCRDAAVEIQSLRDRLDMAAAELTRLRSERAELVEVVRPFAEVAAHDIGESEADTDRFVPMRSYNKAPQITVGDMRRASAALSRVSGGGK